MSRPMPAVGIGILLGLTITGTLALRGSTATPSSPEAKAISAAERRAHALARAPAPNPAQTATYDGPSGRARAQAARAARTVPLPAGATFDGIRWERADPPLSASEIELVLQHNAFCKWLIATTSRRSREQALRILHHVPEWPAMRGGDGFAAHAVAEAKTGHGETLEAALADCRASQRRETQYARSRRHRVATNAAGG